MRPTGRFFFCASIKFKMSEFENTPSPIESAGKNVEVGSTRIEAKILLEFNKENQNKFKSNFEEGKKEIPEELIPIRDEIISRESATGRRIVNGEALSLERFLLTPDGVEFKFKETDYYSFVGTHLALDEELTDGQTVRERFGGLEEMIDVEGYNKSPYAKTVGASTVLITEDNKIILQERSSRVAVAPGELHVSIAEGMHRNDTDETGRIDPVRTALRGIRQELSNLAPGAKPLQFDQSNIELLALGISEKYLQPEFVLKARIPYSSEQILEAAKNARGAWERRRIFAEDFTPENVERLIREEKWSPNGAMALALALKAETNRRI